MRRRARTPDEVRRGIIAYSDPRRGYPFSSVADALVGSNAALRKCELEEQPPRLVGPGHISILVHVAELDDASS